MPVAIQGDHRALAVTGITSRALDSACITVARDVDNGLSLAVAEIDLGKGDRGLYYGIGVEIDLDAQAMIFNLLP
jgi:hypothetical protein